jgi:hypothetical protein
MNAAVAILRLAGLFRLLPSPGTASQACEPDSPHGFRARTLFNSLPHPYGK